MIRAIAAGQWSSAAILQNGTLITWGLNSSGQLGIGNIDNSSVPMVVSNVNGATAIAIGAHAVVAESDGSILSWGNNASGQLGNDTTTSTSAPGQVVGLESVPTAAAPTFSPNGGAILQPVQVTVQCATPGANHCAGYYSHQSARRGPGSIGGNRMLSIRNFFSVMIRKHCSHPLAQTRAGARPRHVRWRRDERFIWKVLVCLAIWMASLGDLHCQLAVKSVQAPGPRVISPHFSQSPGEAEFLTCGVFTEPLVPIGRPSPEENRALAETIETFISRLDRADDSSLQRFLKSYPDSAWSAALLLNLGLMDRQTGYFSKALDAWERAWELSKDAQDIRAHNLADRALSELAELNSRLGRQDQMRALFKEAANRTFRGSAEEQFNGAKRGLWFMEKEPGSSFKCGPLALSRVLACEHSPLCASPLFRKCSQQRGAHL